MSLKTFARNRIRAFEMLAVLVTDKIGDGIAELLYGRTRKAPPDRRVRRYNELGVPAYEMLPRGEERRRVRR